MPKPMYEITIKNIAAIDRKFERNFTDWQPWTPKLTKSDNTGIVLSNRLLTPTRDASQEESLPIPGNIDPAALLRQEVDKGRSVYLEDNTVLYMKRPKTGNGQPYVANPR